MIYLIKTLGCIDIFYGVRCNYYSQNLMCVHLSILIPRILHILSVCDINSLWQQKYLFFILSLESFFPFYFHVTILICYTLARTSADRMKKKQQTNKRLFAVAQKCLHRKPFAYLYRECDSKLAKQLSSQLHYYE